MRALIATLFAVAALSAHTPQVRDVARPADLPTRSGTGAISGIITTDENPARPIRRVTVTISEDLSQRGGRTTVTDDAGRFSFSDLPSGRFLVSAVKAPYLKTAYGATRLSRPGSDRTGTAIVLGDGQRVTNANMRMTRSGVIAGTVRDGSGRPVRGVRMTVYYYRLALATGERTLAAFSPMDSPESTDSRGVYRFYGIPPGEYVIGAAMSGRDITNLEPLSAEDLQRLVDASRPIVGAGATAPTAPAPPVKRRPTVGYAPVYYPGTPVSANATVINLGPAEERTGVDLQLQLVPNAFVTGAVTRPDGLPASGASVMLLTPSLATGMFIGTADATGRYVIRAVPPGSYAVTVRYAATASPAGAAQPASAVMWGESSVDVLGDDVEINAGVQPGAMLPGLVRFQSTSGVAAPDVTKVRLSFRDSNFARGLGSSVNATIDASGRFKMMGLSPGLQRLVATPPAGWALASATIGTDDVIDRGFTARPGADVPDLVVTFTDRVSEISGAIVDAGNRPAPEYYIIAFPANETLWEWQSRRIQQTRPSHDGKYSIKALPAGDYLIAAVTDVDEGEWFDASFLRSIAGAAIKITLGDGERKTQSMQVK